MAQEGLATARAGSRPWSQSCDASFTSMQNAEVVGSRRLSLRFQRKAWEAWQCAPAREVSEAVEVKLKVQWRPQKVADHGTSEESSRQ